MPKRIVTFGSLNIDHVYRVPHFVRPGETLCSTDYKRLAGGKGLNQSIALARAGASVCHAGQVGVDGLWLKQLLSDEGVDTSSISVSETTATGHAIIQVDPSGQNCIVLYDGANRSISATQTVAVIESLTRQSILLVQNETNGLDELLTAAAAKQVDIALNPAPMYGNIAKLLETVAVRWLVVNEIEGAELAGLDPTSAAQQPAILLEALRTRYPGSAIVLTLGAMGCCYADSKQTLQIPAFPCRVLDTTAAGDTFIGYFLADCASGVEVGTALRTASKAASICVSRSGAAQSIPKRNEL